MSLRLPSTLSPSKVESFKSCALAFRFSVIDRLPEPPSPPATKGTLVHLALQKLFWEEPADARTLATALDKLAAARQELRDHPDYADLGLDSDAEEEFAADAEVLVRNYFELEDPGAVRVIGTELQVAAEVPTGNGYELRLRGIIDRLELDDDGELVVTDYKTGHAPRAAFEQRRFGGVNFYAFLCEQLFGRRPARVQLLHLREPVRISMSPSEQSVRGLERRAQAVWSAIVGACLRDDFRPRPSALCDFCSFRAYCPSWGGDLEAARQLAAELRAAAAPDDPQLQLDLLAPSA